MIEWVNISWFNDTGGTVCLSACSQESAIFLISAKYQQQQHNDYCLIFISCVFLMVLSDYNDVTIFTKYFHEIVSAIAYDLNEKIFHCKTADEIVLPWFSHSCTACLSVSLLAASRTFPLTDGWRYYLKLT